MPKWAADLIRETLGLDSQSPAFDPQLRQALLRALGQIREHRPEAADLSTTFYVLEIVGDLEPQLHGPYTSEELRNQQALRLRQQDPGNHNGLFRLDLTPGCQPEVGAYAGVELQAAVAP